MARASPESDVLPGDSEMRKRAHAALRAAIGLAALLSLASAAEPEKITGTVKSVDTSESQVLLITGRGHALRVMVIHVKPGCRIEVDGVAGSMTSLRRGQVVEITYRNEPHPYTAESIATVPSAGPK
jgi:hypothetical protein